MERMRSPTEQILRCVAPPPACGFFHWLPEVGQGGVAFFGFRSLPGFCPRATIWFNMQGTPAVPEEISHFLAGRDS